ncbi:kinesin-domain-containing protein [Obba rivulosa]|uniref:Kinesin-domain-containing protein n=1 Tax=Obba rivulosa TaxID=1052685 RepID=A0A8E2J5H7_9APHY|nr:kinesin-domain-containing protein [Obba rivulosa]
MATRRPATSRSRQNLTSMPPPTTRATRQPSVLTKSNSSQRSEQTTPAEESTEPGPSIHKAARTHIPHQPQEDVETNIQVVLRCRRRSEREIQENSPIIITTTGAKGKDITIETAAPVSSLGLVTLPPTRTYPFDMVFGPEADQAMIYHDVVNPMLEEVLMGYNCTLFAYGQTGTGKTYTMQGDLSTTLMGNPSAQAGMIPRVLFRLFHQLESSGTDYSVKISFVELYNEELRDLLAPELAAPMGSIQPMGMGASKDSGGQGNLKIFDDTTKKGVFIQGLEEAGVKDATDALALLVKGSQRRQIAATKFNDHSSRSHSVFSITVHMKETSSVGDDLLKVGKLNLVDLAGSENIGRSGAENKRAREAGMINQSLLTLGRVINALVDRSSHVPYRESKLTRLLQDSLGGRTKTCIIATISPARSNMEETLSTLDYAMRAKSIRNRPEVNQRMSRNALLKEYVAEMERLKADLLAAREKNGIFFSEESWTQMTVEKELRETEAQEAKKQVEIVEGQLRNLREEFDQSIALLRARDGELKDTREKLKMAEGTLEVKEGQLQAVKGALEEELVVRQAYQESEGTLDNVAGGLKKVAYESLGDLGRLFSKLDRKSSVQSTNTQAVYRYSKAFHIETQTLSSTLEAFLTLSSQHLQKLRSEMNHFQTKEREALAGISERIDRQAEKMREALQTIQVRDDASTDALESIKTAVKQLEEDTKTAMSTWSEELRLQCETSCKTAESTSMASFTGVEKAFKLLGNLAETVIREAQDYVITERQSLQEARTLADSATDAEMARLQEQNTLLFHLLEAEKQKTEHARDELMKRISVLLGDFTSERDRSLREAFSEIRDSNAAAQQEMTRLGVEQGQHLETVMTHGAEWGTRLENRANECKKTRDAGVKTLHAARTTVRDGLSAVQQSVANSVVLFSSATHKRTRQFSATCSEGFDGASRAKRARLDATQTMATDVQSTFRHVQRGIASTLQDVDGASTHVLSEVANLATATDSYGDGASKSLSNLHHATQSLVEEGTKEDAPTGSTPRKRAWNYQDEWELTKPRDILLRDYRQSRLSPVRDEPVTVDHLREDSDAEEPLMPVDDSEPDTEDLESSPSIQRSPPISIPSLTSSTSSTSTSGPVLAPAVVPVAAPAPAPAPARALAHLPASLPAPPPITALKKTLHGTSKSGLPTMGTLTERSTNILAGRRTRGFQR